jgi:hypothetical protein
MEFSPAKIVDFMGFTGIFPCEHIFYRDFTGIKSEITVYVYITNNNMGLLELTMLRGISGSMEVFFWCD